jgi:hypothetical protein
MSSRHPLSQAPDIDDIISQLDPADDMVLPPKLKRDCRKISFAHTAMTLASRKHSSVSSLHEEPLEEDPFFFENEEKK